MMKKNLMELFRNLLGRRSRRSRSRASGVAEFLEDRSLLSSLSLSGGSLTYTAGTGISNNVTVSFAAGNYTVSDSSENINLNGALISAGWLGTGTGTVSGPAAALTGGFFRFNLGDQNDQIAINSFQTGEEGLIIDGQGGTDTGTLNGALTGIAQNGVQITSENLSLNAGISTTTQPILLTVGATTLGADVTLATAGSALTVSGTLDSDATARDLTLNGGAGIVTLSGAVGGTSAIDQLSSTSTNRSQLQSTVRANNVSVTGSARLSNDVTALTDDITLNGPALLLGDVVLTSGGGAGDDILISNTLTGSVASRDLTLNAGGGNVTATSALGALLDSFNVTANLASFSNTVTANSIQVTGNVAASTNLRAEVGGIAINGNLTLNGAVILFGAPGADISVSGTTQGAGGNLFVQATSGSLDEVSFTGAVSGINQLQITSAGAAAVNFGNTVSANNVSLLGTIVRLADDVTALLDDVIINGNVLLLGGTLADPISLTSGQGAGDDVTVSGTINAQAATLRNLSVTAGAGVATFSGHVGATTALQSLSINASTASTQQLRTQAGGLTIVANDVAVAGTMSGTGVLSISTQTAAREIRVGGSASGTALNLSAAELGLIADGFSQIRIGSATSGAIIVGTATTFLDQVILTGSQIDVSQMLSAGNNRVTLIANEVNLAAMVGGAGHVVIDTLSDGIGVRLGGTSDSGAAFLDLTSTELAQIPNGHASITIIGSTSPAADNIEVLSALTFNDAITLQTSGVIVSPFDLTAGSAVDPITMTLIGDLSLGGDLTAYGRRIQVTGSITLTSDSSIDTTGAGAVPGGQQILVGGAVNGPFNLSFTAGTSTSGIISVTGSIGAVTPVGDLIVVSAANRAVFGGSIDAQSVGVTANQIRLGGNVDSAGSIALTGAVLLTADSVMTSGGGAADSIILSGTVASFTTGMFDLSMNAGAGDVTVGGAIGGNIDTLTFAADNVSLASTATANSITAAATLVQVAGAWRSNLGNIMINADLELNGGAMSFFFGGGGALSVTGTVTATAGQSLTVRALSGSPIMGSVTFGDTVSGIGSLEVVSSGSTISSSITASGNISWTVPEAVVNGDNLIINGGVLISSTSGNIYLFAADTVTNNGTVTAPLGTVTIISGGNP